jgi:hypothetical protein
MDPRGLRAAGFMVQVAAGRLVPWLACPRRQSAAFAAADWMTQKLPNGGVVDVDAVTGLWLSQ